jgi:hypothetical protein
MTFEEAQAAGMALAPSVRAGDLFMLTNHDAFPSLLGLLEEMKEAVAIELCAPETHTLPGLLNRAAGQLSCLEELKNRMRAAREGPPPKE